MSHRWEWLTSKYRAYQIPSHSLQSLLSLLGIAPSTINTLEAMVSLCIAFLCGFIAAVSTLNLASQGSIAVASDIPTSSLNLLDLLSPSSQSVSWPNISFPPARPPFMATNVSALKALGLDTDTPVYWQTTPSGNTMAVQCHVRHGRRLDYQDCRDAYRYIPRSDARIARFAERHTRWPHDIALPQRNLGSMSSHRV